jgi:heme exporter protein D
MAEFFHMGGYAAFIWPAYGLSAFVLTTLTVLSLRSFKATRALADVLEQDRPTREQSAAASSEVATDSQT